MLEKISARISTEAFEIVAKKAVSENRNFTNALETLILEYGRMAAGLTLPGSNTMQPQMANHADSQSRNIIAQSVHANSITIRDENV